MPKLIKQGDGSVVWDYDLPDEPPKKSAKKAGSTPDNNDAEKGDD